MEKSYFIDKYQVEKWVTAAQNIEEKYGTEKALGYLIGEKFYNLVDSLRTYRKSMTAISKKRKDPKYNPVKTIKVSANRKHTINLEDEYKDCKEKVKELEEKLPEFVNLVNDFFERYKILEYFNSEKRLGALGHVFTKEQHDFFIERGAVEHSIDTEIDDAMILGDMMKYFGCFPSPKN